MPPTKTPRRRLKPEFVHQFLVALTGTEPLVWRRLQVPQRYSFWDLHVAIQDAMGWSDYHLHEFRLFDEASQALVSIGIPTGEEAADRPLIAGWNVPLSRFFHQRGWHDPPATYAYDFGDDWEHVVVHEDWSRRTIRWRILDASREKVGARPRTAVGFTAMRHSSWPLPILITRNTSRCSSGPVENSTRRRSIPRR